MTELELSRRERKKDETRERIFKVAVKLFRDNGFEATTIDDITERADVAKGTFFNYFPKKEAVLGYLSETLMTKAVENAEAILAAPKPAREKIIVLYADIGAGYEKDRELSWFLLMENMKRAFAGSEHAFERWRELAVEVIEQGQANGQLKRGLDSQRAQIGERVDRPELGHPWVIHHRQVIRRVVRLEGVDELRVQVRVGRLDDVDLHAGFRGVHRR
jgi:AcrR family transcriptional regulator